MIESFAAQDEIYQICFFGREVEGKQDSYSDIDMIVYSNDLAKTQAEYKEIFGSISPVRATFTLESTADGFAEMMMLVDYTPYQKIDFSIGDFGKKFWLFLTVYDDPAKSKISPTKLNNFHIKQDVAYKLTEVLFSVPRFTKCLFRGDTDMYRRWKSITDLVFVLLHEKQFGWQAETLKAKVGVLEIKRLFEDLDIAEKKQIQLIYPPDARLDLARSYQTSIDLFIELSRQKAEYLGVELNDEFINYIKDFMKAEIRRFQAQAVA